MEEERLKEVLEQFHISSEIIPYGNGHINDTYRISSPACILQRINTQIFTDPDSLMENVQNVTAFLKKKILAAGGNPERETLTVVLTKDGKNCYHLDDSHVYRMYRFIKKAKSIGNSKTPENMYEAGVGFGHFQSLLADFPAESLHETIRDFHNTPKRVEALREAVCRDICGRAAGVKREIDFALEQAVWADAVVKGMKEGSITIRVTHNDTKIDNILFDEESNKALCVIDLDTVMPGSLLYDFGDALRMGGSSAAEDETDLEKVWFETKAFEAFAKGYLREMRDFLTAGELELMPLSVKLMTYECGIRFLTDYLEGDTYFKMHRDNHNLDRARNQFKLVADISDKEKSLAEIIEQLRSEELPRLTATAPGPVR